MALMGAVGSKRHTTSVNKEFGKVPLDVGVLRIQAVLGQECSMEVSSARVGGVKSAKTGFALQPCVQGDCLFAVHVYLCHLGEGGAVSTGAEGMDLFKRAGGLFAKLVAREVDYL